MNFGTKGCMYNCGDECTGECMKVETKTKMSKEEITEIQKHFTCYSKSDYVSYLYEPQKVIGHYSHTEEDYFKIIIFEDDSVYQINSEHETQGIELKNYEKLVERFESFTGERMD